MENNYYYEFNENGNYCYKNSSVLVNKFNIRDEKKLAEIEREITSLKHALFLSFPIPDELNFEYLKSIHKFLFGNIYEWAG